MSHQSLSQQQTQTHSARASGAFFSSSHSLINNSYSHIPLFAEPLNHGSSTQQRAPREFTSTIPKTLTPRFDINRVPTAATIVDLEVPTAPPSPVLRPSTLYPRAHEDPSKRDLSNPTPPPAPTTKRKRKVPRLAPPQVIRTRTDHNIPREPVCADEPRCVICYKWLLSLPIRRQR
jgi:hypothetical protein